MYWVNLKLARGKGLTLYKTKSNAIILYDTLPSYCVENVVTMRSADIFTTKTTSLHAHRKGSSCKKPGKEDNGTTQTQRRENRKSTSEVGETRCFEQGRQFSKSRLQNPGIAAFDSGKSRRLKKNESQRKNSSDREPSSPRCAESRLDAKSNVQLVQ